MCWSWDPEQDCDKQGPIPQSLLLAWLLQYAKHTPSSLWIQTGSCCRVWEALVLVALVHLIQERQMFWWITVGCYLIQHEIIIFQKGNLTHLIFTLIKTIVNPTLNLPSGTYRVETEITLQYLSHKRNDCHTCHSFLDTEHCGLKIKQE